MPIDHPLTFCPERAEVRRKWLLRAYVEVMEIPKGQPRPRAFSRNGRVRVYDPGTAEAWKNDIAIAARDQLAGKKLSGPLCLSVAFFLPRPKYLEKDKSPDYIIPHAIKPDIDNLIKGTMDALTKIGAWGDDSQICECYLTKDYVAKGQPSGAIIQVFTLGGKS